ncbi:MULTISPECIES: helix-turn-helix transcriptional regulator [Halorussus]|uniref:ArsR/SmtB family transcription factor n=1 Tax=Halorussus TaxID=1070314 RepID=UPI000E21745E|nr:MULTISPECIES: hypothetical protein [Halorussus]NHN59315.1 hypothetical protein [Halorussus sp. JP-T4]
MQRRIDRVCRALAHPLRRELLCLLSGRDDHVAEFEELLDRMDDPPADRSAERLEAAAHHEHLPLLREAGLVEYDPRTGTVRYRDPPPASELVEVVLEEHREPSD